MAVEYEDRWITVTGDALEVRGYYFPWGRKRIPFGKIRAVERTDLTRMRGQWRIWGTANPRYWFSLDPGRPHKTTGLVLDVGHSVHPVITPDDPDTVEDLIREHRGS